MVDGPRGFEPGRLVKSTAGRDRGRYFIVIREIDERFCEVADGDLRRLPRPKKKNKRHLQLQPHVATELAQRWQQGQKVTNRDIRRAIQSLVPTEDDTPLPEGG